MRSNETQMMGGQPLDNILGIWEPATVKTTLEIDDDLYREAKAHASLTGQKMKDLVTKGLRLALLPELAATGPAAADATHKLEACFAEADALMQSAPRGPIARDHLTEGRNRLAKP
jgi:hypothetical protein